MAQYCILSFGKVSSIDASAAEQLRMAVKRVSEHGCKEPWTRSSQAQRCLRKCIRISTMYRPYNNIILHKYYIHYII